MTLRRRFRPLRRHARTLLFTACYCLAASPLLAQAGEDLPAANKGYSIPYALTGLCILLGMLVLCRPFYPREDSIKRPEAKE